MRRRRPVIELKNDDQLRTMRAAGLLVAQILAAVREAAAPGVSPIELDRLAAAMIAEAGAVSSFLNYGGGYGLPPYPAVTCISVNSTIVHGIPAEQPLEAGDLVSVDFGLSLDGWHGDSAITFGVGEIAAELDALSEATRTAMWAGIAAAHIGGRVGDISAAVERSIRRERIKYGIVAEYTGHGIGSAMHQDPDVPNLGRAGRGEQLVKGMCLAVEPMITLGSAHTAVLEDEWTVVTRDGSAAAHWEHTFALTSRGLWVLTADDGGEAELTARGVAFGPLDQ
jgi:methionine aminopeptidase, type I